MSRDFRVRYVGGERWRTAEAAREYREEAEVQWGGQVGLRWVMGDDELRDLVKQATAYLATRDGLVTAPAEMIMSSGPDDGGFLDDDVVVTCPDIPLDPEENAETCHCGGKIRFGRCRECHCHLTDEQCDELAQRWSEQHYRS